MLKLWALPFEENLRSSTSSFLGIGFFLPGTGGEEASLFALDIFRMYVQ